MPVQSSVVVGHIKAIYRYPVKSMRGEPLDMARLGFRGLSGDRRFAFIQTANTSGFPWLTGRQYPGLVRYTPSFAEPSIPHKSAVRVLTPDGMDLPLDSPLLRERLEQASQRKVHLLHLDFNRTYDIAEVSLISTGTLTCLSNLVGRPLEPLRFRPNIVIETLPDLGAYPENEWVGGTLALGAEADAPRVRVQFRDPRCKMVDINPETGIFEPGALSAMIHTRATEAGVYGAVVQPGAVMVGAPVSLLTS